MKDQVAVVVMMIIQMSYTGSFLLSKAAISLGVNFAVFVVYRIAIGAVFLAPFAYFYDRNTSPITWRILGIISLLSIILGLSINLNCVAIKYVPATYSNGMFNTVSLLVFVMAVSFRLERVGIREREGQAKMGGLVLNLIGAAIFSLYKGISLYPKSAQHNSISRVYTKQETIKGCLMTVGSHVTFALWINMQTILLKEYKAPLRQMTLQSFFICLMTMIYALIVERNPSSWKIGWGTTLISVLYTGIVLTGIVYTATLWVLKKKGPVFVACFNPLSLIFTAIISAIFFHETLYLGSVIGATILVVGLYSYLWGKKIEAQKQCLNSAGPDCVVPNQLPEENTGEP